VEGGGAAAGAEGGGEDDGGAEASTKDGTEDDVKNGLESCPNNTSSVEPTSPSENDSERLMPGASPEAAATEKKHELSSPESEDVVKKQELPSSEGEHAADLKLALQEGDAGQACPVDSKIVPDCADSTGDDTTSAGPSLLQMLVAEAAATGINGCNPQIILSEAGSAEAKR